MAVADAMLGAGTDADRPAWRSASFACLGSRMTGLHQYVLGHAGRPRDLPANRADEGTARSLVKAHALYVARNRLAPGGSGERRPAILMVVQPGERNAFDQVRHMLCLSRPSSLPELIGLPAAPSGAPGVGARSDTDHPPHTRGDCRGCCGVAADGGWACAAAVDRRV